MAADTAVRPGRRSQRATAPAGTVATEVVRTSRRSLLLWGLALAAVATIYVSFYPAIGEQQMAEMADLIPEDLAAALGYDRMGDPAGYLTSTVFGLLGPALLLVYAIGAGARLVAGQEEDGTLELELTAPVGRRSVFTERLAGLWVDVAILVAVVAVVTILLVVGLGVDVGVGGILAGSAGLLVFAVAHGTLAFGAGAATGRRTVGLGVAAAVAVVGYVGDAIGPVVDGAGWLQAVSPWHWYLGRDPLVDGLDAVGIALLAGLTAIAAVAGLARFQRRDLGV